MSVKLTQSPTFVITDNNPFKWLSVDEVSIEETLDKMDTIRENLMPENKNIPQIGHVKKRVRLQEKECDIDELIAKLGSLNIEEVKPKPPKPSIECKQKLREAIKRAQNAMREHLFEFPWDRQKVNAKILEERRARSAEQKARDLIFQQQIRKGSVDTYRDYKPAIRKKNE